MADNSPTTPSTPPRKRLSRDQRRDILLMRKLGHSYTSIATFLHVTERAVQYTCQKEEATPQHHKTGRPPRLNEEEVDRLVAFVTSTHRTRCLPYHRLAAELWPGGEIGVDSVRHALYSRGYRRRVALKKPPLTPAHKVNRLQWAQQHLTWTQEQWREILWTDETWVTAGNHRKVWITRKTGEELDPTCVVEKHRKKGGWMFWGSFVGNQKGPHLFWEKAWGTINKETYCEHTVPLIVAYIRENPSYFLMQDNAPGHSAQYTRDELIRLGVQLIFWPANSPDLNPIETVWNKMKDWLQLHYPGQTCSYPQLRRQVNEAWDAIGEDLLNDLIESMPARCQAVIDAAGGHTKF
jgi:transposase